MNDHLLELTEALTAWLHFEASCGRQEAFEEKYLIGPIFNFLEHRYHGQVRTNCQHPYLANKEKVDFVVLGSEPEKWDVAIETKWLDSQSPHSAKSLKRIIKDLLRLELIARRRQCEHAWFLLGGPTTVFSEFWYQNKRTRTSRRHKEFAEHLLPASKHHVGLEPEILRLGQDKPTYWPLARRMFQGACDTPGMTDVELGRRFELLPAKPFSRLSGDDPKRFPYCLPPLSHAVYGWRVGVSQSFFCPAKEFAVDASG